MHTPYTLQWVVTCPPSKVPLPVGTGVSGLQSNAKPTHEFVSCYSNGILIGRAVSAQFSRVRWRRCHVMGGRSMEGNMRQTTRTCDTSVRSYFTYGRCCPLPSYLGHLLLCKYHFVSECFGIDAIMLDMDRKLSEYCFPQPISAFSTPSYQRQSIWAPFRGR